jgi:hypothetical protein
METTAARSPITASRTRTSTMLPGLFQQKHPATLAARRPPGAPSAVNRLGTQWLDLQAQSASGWFSQPPVPSAADADPMMVPPLHRTVPAMTRPAATILAGAPLTATLTVAAIRSLSLPGVTGPSIIGALRLPVTAVASLVIGRGLPASLLTLPVACPVPASSLLAGVAGAILGRAIVLLAGTRIVLTLGLGCGPAECG